MNALDAIEFDKTGLTPIGERDGARAWITAAEDGVILHYFAKPPNINAALDSIDDVRAIYREQAVAAGMGMIEVETLRIDGCAVVRTIFKVPQKPSGMTYIGALTLPFRDFSYVVKVQCQEQGVTGIRESVVLDVMLEAEEVEVQDDGQLVGWMQDRMPRAGKAVASPLIHIDQYDIR